jgi:hypothetical protein
MSDIYYHYYLNKILKAVLLGLIVLILFYIWHHASNKNLNEVESRPQDITEKISEQSSNISVTLNNSVFQGVNKDLEPYNIIARKVLKTSDKYYKFNFINANYLMNGINMIINAGAGFLDDETKWVNLNDDVEVLFDGFRLRTDTAMINLYNKDLQSNSRSDLFFKHSTISADGFSTNDNNSKIKFEGHVITHINLGDFK